MSEIYIAHHGVKGMRWGIRRYQNADGSLTPAGIKRYSAKTREIRGHGGPGMYIGGPKRQLAGAKRDLEFLNKGGHLSKGITKEKQEAYDKRDRAALEKKITKNEAKIAKNEAKNARKEAIKETTKEIRKNASFADKLVYNESTRKRAAKYIVDNNMTVAEATRRAKSDAWANTAVIVAGYGAATLVSLYHSR